MTCLCLTRNRRQWLPQAIACYRRQAYQRRELLILADGEDVRDLVPQDDSIRLIHVEGHPDIGSKRNFGCSAARGSLIAHWDDDDYSGPGRVAEQVSRIADSGKSCAGYHSMRFTDGARCWRYHGVPHYAVGTSLLYRREWWQSHPFPALQTCEEIDRLESDADRVMRPAMSTLFREEPDVREVIKLKAIYELLETITDKCEDVANVIEGIILENS